MNTVYFIVGFLPFLIVYYGFVVGGIMLGEYKRRRTIVFDLLIPFWGFFRMVWKNVLPLCGDVMEDMRDGWRNRPW